MDNICDICMKKNGMNIITISTWREPSPSGQQHLCISRSWVKTPVWWEFKRQLITLQIRVLKYGPPDAFVRPANTSKNEKSIKFDQIYLILRAFLVFCGPQKLFSYKLRHAEHFSSSIWPSNQFEFETPGLDHQEMCIFCVRKNEHILAQTNGRDSFPVRY
jgi:hypothetical protein